MAIFGGNTTNGAAIMIKLMKLVGTVFFLFMACLYARGSGGTVFPHGYSFSAVDGSDGLSHNNVKSILQDSHGFMWLGTRNKLNRYDGYTMKVFSCADQKKHVVNNNISALFEDKEENIWIGTDNGVFLFDPVREVFSFLDVRTKDGVAMSDWVADIQADKNGNVWIVIPNQGVFRYAVGAGRLFRYNVVRNLKPGDSNPQCIAVESNGNVWIGTNHEGVFLYHREEERFEQYLGDKGGDESLEGKNIYSICDYGEELLIGIHEEKLMKLHKRSNTLAHVDAHNVDYKIIRDIKCYDHKIWVATQDGVFLVDENAHKTVHFYNDPSLPYSIADNTVEKIYRDREGNVWLATHFGGASYLPNRGYQFDIYLPDNSGQSISSKIVREIHEDGQGRIWIGTEDNGLNLFDPDDKTFRHIPLSDRHQHTLGIMLRQKEVWVGAFKDGLDIVHLDGRIPVHYQQGQLGLEDNSLYAIFEDSQHNIWIGNAWGVYKAERGKWPFTRMGDFGSVFVFDIQEDRQGNIWVATMGNGVFRYDPKIGIAKHYVAAPRVTGSISSNSVSSITVTREGEIWFSTDRGGICHYNKGTDSFTAYDERDGLPDDIVYKILDDREGNLWFGTSKGLVKFNPQSKRIRVFTRNDGLPENQFNYKSGLVSSKGLLYFGTLNGMMVFDPYALRKNGYMPPVFITRLTVFNKELSIDDESPLKKSILYTREITLPYDQANIGLDFAALSYISPKANQYQYRMDGVDAGWINAQETRTSYYAKLPPGNYVFRVRGANNDGLWNPKEAKLAITILPPWWLSKVAIFFYVLLGLSIASLLLYWYNKRITKRRSEQQRLFEIEKEKELYGLKVDFFTNIAHEIRTPVTLISGPLEAIMQSGVSNAVVKKNLQLIEKSAAQLLSLVNQLLDFRKVDSRKFPLHYGMCNVTLLLKETADWFSGSVGNLHKQLRTSFPAEDVVASIDEGALTKILNNLLANALKYSKDATLVSLEDQRDEFIIKISSDGPKIPAEYQDKIFETFYRLDPDENAASSSGIGLSLARSLAQLLNGTLTLDQASDQNTFVLRLPKGDTATDDTDVFTDDLPDGSNVVLLVEDSPDLLGFLNDRLSEMFVLITAKDGLEALEILKKKRIDIIITDIMMPNMNGIQLCAAVKGDENLSHIPIILLTAKSDLPSKISGLEAGAEAYLEKPFSVSHLIMQVSTILDNRRRQREAFLKKPFQRVQQIGMSKADEQFMEKIVQIIHDHLSDANLNVETLAAMSFVSRASLLRKLKSLTGLSPTDFIKAIRLKKAAEYLLTGGYQVNEVAYLVGIGSPSYFIKMFHKQFGITPAEFVKQHNMERAE